MVAARTGHSRSVAVRTGRAVAAGTRRIRSVAVRIRWAVAARARRIGSVVPRSRRAVAGRIRRIGSVVPRTRRGVAAPTRRTGSVGPRSSAGRQGGRVETRGLIVVGTPNKLGRRTNYCGGRPGLAGIVTVTVLVLVGTVVVVVVAAVRAVLDIGPTGLEVEFEPPKIKKTISTKRSAPRAPNPTSAQGLRYHGTPGRSGGPGGGPPGGCCPYPPWPVGWSE